MQPKQVENYTTNWEIEFLNGLGTYSEMSGTKQRLLRQYINTSHKRKDWNGMDRGKILSHARKLLGECNAL